MTRIDTSWADFNDARRRIPQPGDAIGPSAHSWRPRLIPSPVLRSDVDQIAGRVLRVCVASRVSCQRGQTPLHLEIGCSGLRMGSEVVAEQQRVPLVRSPLHPDVQVDASAPSGLAEESLAPCDGSVERPGTRWSSTMCASRRQPDPSRAPAARARASSSATVIWMSRRPWPAGRAPMWNRCDRSGARARRRRREGQRRSAGTPDSSADRPTISTIDASWTQRFSTSTSGGRKAEAYSLKLVTHLSE
jgi:hypothetical protein